MVTPVGPKTKRFIKTYFAFVSNIVVLSALSLLLNSDCIWRWCTTLSKIVIPDIVRRIEIFQSVWLASNAELYLLNTIELCRWCMTHWHNLLIFGLCQPSKLKKNLEAEAASETSCFFNLDDGQS